MLNEPIKDMDDGETAAHLRRWVEHHHGPWLWPTDACGYDQHIRFVRHKNAQWTGGNQEEFKKFVLAYANELDQGTEVGKCDT